MTDRRMLKDLNSKQLNTVSNLSYPRHDDALREQVTYKVESHFRARRFSGWGVLQGFRDFKAFSDLGDLGSYMRGGWDLSS